MWQKGTSVYSAAKKTGIPIQTLRDRVLGYIFATVTTSGPCCILGKENENNLAEHVKKMSKFGYGYSKSELCTLGTDLAVYLGLRQEESARERALCQLSVYDL